MLAFRNYGDDIVVRLKEAGLSEAYIDRRYCETFFGYGRPVMVANL